RHLVGSGPDRRHGGRERGRQQLAALGRELLDRGLGLVEGLGGLVELGLGGLSGCAIGDAGQGRGHAVDGTADLGADIDAAGGEALQRVRDAGDGGGGGCGSRGGGVLGGGGSLLRRVGSLLRRVLCCGCRLLRGLFGRLSAAVPVVPEDRDGDD